MNCIDLREMFGESYRIEFDDAYDRRNVPRTKLDPWMMTIPCQGGGITIYPHGGNVLAIEVNGRRNIAKKLASLGLKLWQGGDDERTFLFDISVFPAVAQVAKAKRRPQFTEEQRGAIRQRLASYTFRSAEESTKSSAGRAQMLRADIPLK